jgi:arabinose-5-phosphate isomerase
MMRVDWLESSPMAICGGQLSRLNHDALARLTCDDFMTRKPAVATPDLLAYDALQLMENRPSQISVLPVVDLEGICVGLIDVHDIVRSGL